MNTVTAVALEQRRRAASHCRIQQFALLASANAPSRPRVRAQGRGSRQGVLVELCLQGDGKTGRRIDARGSGDLPAVAPQVGDRSGAVLRRHRRGHLRQEYGRVAHPRTMLRRPRTKRCGGARRLNLNVVDRLVATAVVLAAAPSTGLP